MAVEFPKLPDHSDELNSLFESAPDLMFTENLSGRITRVNLAFERITGYSKAQAVEKSFLDLVVPEQKQQIESIIQDLQDGAIPRPYALAINTESRGRVVLQVLLQLAASNGPPLTLHGFARDVTDRRLTSTEVQLLEKTTELARFSRYLQLLHRLSTTNYVSLQELFADYLSTGCEIFDVSSGVLTKWNKGGFTVRAAHLAGGRVHSDELDLFSSRIAKTKKTFTCARAVGEGRSACPYAFYIGTPILLDDEVYGTIGFWADEDIRLTQLHPQAREVIELMAKSIAIAIHQRSLTDQLAHQATHDALTGLPNRLLLKERLDSALHRAEEGDSLVTVVFIDLDRFKQINDTLGHSIGDRLLQQIADRLHGEVGDCDTLARMGGDEFTAILTGFRTVESAVQHVRHLLAAVRKPCRVDAYELFITASLGVSFYPQDGRDAATLLRNADSAMYTAKNSGKNDFRCFSAGGIAAALKKLELENFLRRALEKKELQVFHQPQVDLSGNLAGLEVLTVWEHPKLGRISPSQFIPIAEESGMILPIGSWVLHQACQQSVCWQKAGYAPVPVAVNVSALQFGQANFVDLVAETLAATGLDAGYLELELTESLVMRDVEQSARRMSELRSLGVRIAIDDFGTGYSSLSYLRRLPADTLKIDQSFLQEIEIGFGRSQLFETIVKLAHNMGLRVTAEGVENSEQLDLARQAGCDTVQGHLFGGPLSVTDVEQLLTRAGKSALITQAPTSIA
jgi:diguanylate cyclase (GGDEF)-like protein/PAS domain S-box-containing protein